MLNKTGITKVSGKTRNVILINQSNSTSLPCIIDDVGAVTVGGRKIHKAGTPVSGDLKQRGSAFSVDTATPNGILVHDVDVTEGNANAAVLIFGFVDKSKLESDVQAMITTGVETSLNMIKFII